MENLADFAASVEMSAVMEEMVKKRPISATN